MNVLAVAYRKMVGNFVEKLHPDSAKSGSDKILVTRSIKADSALLDQPLCSLDPNVEKRIPDLVLKVQAPISGKYGAKISGKEHDK